jgi:hypothetical protein
MLQTYYPIVMVPHYNIIKVYVYDFTILQKKFESSVTIISTEED